MTVADSAPASHRQLVGDGRPTSETTFTSNTYPPLRPADLEPEMGPVLSAAEVAKIVAAAPSIGYARHALETLGWRAVIAGNRITVNERVFAQYVGVLAASQGQAMWMVHALEDATPIWVSGAP